MNRASYEVESGQVGKSRKSTTLYEAGLVSLCAYWFLYRTQALSRLTPKLVLGGIDYGLYAIALIVFGIIFGLLRFLERNLGTPRWVAGMRSHQGTSRYVDILVLIACFMIFAVAFGNEVLGSQPFLVIVLIIASLSATQSLLMGYESYHALTEGEIEVLPQKTPDSENPDEIPMDENEDDEDPEVNANLDDDHS